VCAQYTLHGMGVAGQVSSSFADAVFGSRSWRHPALHHEPRAQRRRPLPHARQNSRRSCQLSRSITTGHIQGLAQGREAGARLVRNCQLAILPGLLQTAEYARLVIPQTDPTGELDHAAAVAQRLERQLILYQEGRRFEFVIGEQVLAWSPGAGVMPAQLDRLVSVATLAAVELRILPLRRTAGPAWHSFVHFQPADPADAPYVTTELLHGGQRITDPGGVATYERAWATLWEAAAAGAEALQIVKGHWRSWP